MQPVVWISHLRFADTADKVIAVFFFPPNAHDSENVFLIVAKPFSITMKDKDIRFPC